MNVYVQSRPTHLIVGKWRGTITIGGVRQWFTAEFVRRGGNIIGSVGGMQVMHFHGDGDHIRFTLPGIDGSTLVDLYLCERDTLTGTVCRAGLPGTFAFARAGSL
jgi:hypothetical protein